jgi:hypothetical protein
VRCPIAIVAAACAAGAQGPSRFSPPPDFSQSAITAAAESLAVAWNLWTRTAQDMERQVLQLPMSDARDSIGRALGRYLDFLDKRNDYSEAVLSYIEECRLHPNPRQPLVTREEVFEDQARLIGANVMALHGKLNSLKDSAEWTAVYLGVQEETDRALKLQSQRRSEVPLDLSLDSPKPPSPISSLVYRVAERELREELQRLWTGYYQVLVNTIEQKPGGSAPLVAIRSAGRAASTGEGTASESQPAGPPNPAAVVPDAWKPFVGAWAYTAGSQQFNGVAEPAYALLELWFENDVLVGRYRAELPDFQGSKKIDLRLQGAAAAAGHQVTLRFESKNPPATGQCVLEAAGPSGVDMMLLRTVAAGSPIPRGRELLRRR